MPEDAPGKGSHSRTPWKWLKTWAFWSRTQEIKRWSIVVVSEYLKTSHGKERLGMGLVPGPLKG